MNTEIKHKFNIVDIIIVMVFLLLVTYGVKKLTQPTELKGTIDTVQVQFSSITEETIKYLKPEEVLYSPRYKKGRKPYARILNIMSVIPMKVTEMSSDGRMIASDHPFLKTAVVTIAFNIPVEVYADKFVYPGSSFRLNLHMDAPFEFKSLSLKLLGKITNISYKSLEAE